eukprot:364937-Chlamydomonas_euryale.AAC.24
MRFTKTVFERAFHPCPLCPATRRKGPSPSRLSLAHIPSIVLTLPGRQHRRWADFSGGDSCGRDMPNRTLRVTIECGGVERLSDAVEPITCEYMAKLTTPLACTQQKRLWMDEVGLFHPVAAMRSGTGRLRRSARTCSVAAACLVIHVVRQPRTRECEWASVRLSVEPHSHALTERVQVAPTTWDTWDMAVANAFRA